MQETIPYKTWLPIVPRDNNQSSPSIYGGAKNVKESKSGGGPKNTVSENAVVVFGRRGCCMIHVVKRLLLVVGVNPAVNEIDEEVEEDVIDELETISGDRKESRLQLPAVFIGGRLFGGLDRIIGAHISGELTPVLKQAGALWL